jgi:hypothetical protein
MHDISTLDGLLGFLKEDIPRKYDGRESDFESWPTFFLVSPGEDKPVLSVVVAPFRNAEEKSLVLARARLMMFKEGVTHYVFCSEVWGATYSANAPMREAPSKRLDRVEMLSLAGADRTGKKVQWNWKIERGSDSVVLVEGNNDSHSELGGRLFSLLDDMPTGSPKEIDEAVKKIEKVFRAAGIEALTDDEFMSRDPATTKH